MAWMVLRWSTFKIMSSDSDLHPRWPPSANVVLTYIFSIGSYVKTKSSHGGHLEFSIRAKNKNLVYDHPMNISARWNCNIIEIMTGWSSTKLIIFVPITYPRWPPWLEHWKSTLKDHNIWHWKSTLKWQ
jgi:hypothetical protein